MKYVYELQSYYSGWSTWCFWTNKKRAIKFAKKYPNISTRVLKQTVNPDLKNGGIKSIPVWEYSNG